MKQQSVAKFIGATITRMNVSDIKALLVIVPPRREQDAIARYVDKYTQPFARARNTIEGEIAHLIEYRTRLIADVVTGKVDVRELAAGLPEVGEAGLLEEVPLEDETTGDDDEPGPAEEDAGADD